MELLEIWGEINFESQIVSEEHFLDQPLWCYSLIRISNKPGFFYIQKFGFINGVDNVNWPLYRDSKS